MTPSRIDRDAVGEGELTEEEEIYRDNILDHYKHPHNKGAPSHFDLHALENNPLCGDKIEVFLCVDADGQITRASFSGSGCAISQAAISMLTDRLTGMDLAEAKQLRNDDVLSMLGIKIGVVRQKCALLSLRAVKSALAGRDVQSGDQCR